MAVAVSGLFRSKCAMNPTPGMCAMGRRHLMCLFPRLASAQSLELKPLRTINRSIGSSRQTRAAAQSDSDAQLTRPGVVAYDRSLANSINLIGNVGVSPNIQYQDSGEAVATSSLSVKKTPKGEPTWFFLEFQSNLAEIAAQHVRKGDRIHVAGRILVENVSVPDAEQKQTLVKVAVTELHFVDDVYGAQAVHSAPVVTTAAQAVHSAPVVTTAAPAVQKKSSSIEKRQAAEKAWKLFFENPTTWYDNRADKRNPKAPDFKHKTTGEALWIDGFYVPTFVSEKIAELEEDGSLPKVERKSNVSTSSSSVVGSGSTGEYTPF